MSAVEDFVEKALARSKTTLPHIARFCLVSTFFEDGIRMWVQWHEQAEYLSMSWNSSYITACLFILYNLIGQLGAVTMVLLRFKTDLACLNLFLTVILQTIAYNILWDIQFLFRNFALCGALLLVVAESKVEDKSLFAGVPSLGENKTKSYLQLAGRVLMVFMFLTLLKFELNAGQMVQNIVGSALMILVTVGYKTKLSSLILVTWLNLLNFYFNAWWTIPVHKPLRDFLKFDFFQTLSVIGGLLMVVVLGPGGASVDERKKNW